MKMVSPTAVLTRSKICESDEDIATIERADAIYDMLSDSERAFIDDLRHWYSSIRFEVFKRPNWLWSAYVRIVARRANVLAAPSPLDYLSYPICTLIGRYETWRSDKARKAFLERTRRAADEDKRGLLGALTYLRIINFSISAKNFRTEFNEITDLYVRSGKVPEKDRIEALRFVKKLEDRHSELRRAYYQKKNAKRSSGSQTEGQKENRGAKVAAGSDETPAAEVTMDSPPSTPWEFLLKLTREDPEKAIDVARKQWKSEQDVGEFSRVQLIGTPDLAYELAVFFKPHFEAFACYLLNASVTWTGHAVIRASRSERSAPLAAQLETRATLFAEWIESLRRSEQPIETGYLLTMLQHGNPSQPYWDSLMEASYTQAVQIASHEKRSPWELVAWVAFYAGVGSALAERASALFEKMVFQSMDAANDVKTGFDITWDLTGAIKLVEEKTMSRRNPYFSANPDHSLVMLVQQRLRHTIGEILSMYPSNVMELTAKLMTQVRVEVLFRELDAVLREALAARLRSFPTDAAKALIHVTRYCGYSQVDDEMYRKHVCEATFNEFFPVLHVISPDDADTVRPHIGWDPTRDIF